uniref:Uncharacterized protein n=1 Tax=Mola mola TaxID=94237 RepID=A0A3Q3X5Z4_MOLML
MCVCDMMCLFSSREEHLSSWVFPTWLPSINDWHLLVSVMTSLCRGSAGLTLVLLKDIFLLCYKTFMVTFSVTFVVCMCLVRFTSVPADPNRWDMLLFAGGPVWAMEWCPTPDGAPVTQYVALACHRGMDDQHYVNKMYGGPALIQLWDVGKLECNNRYSQPILVYGLAQDKGFIWHLKWCPAGGWESPTCGTNAPLLPRLGLLAVATSNGVVTIYSLPHPDALNTNKKQDNCGKTAQGVVTLKLGSFNAPRHERSGQILSMDWLPEKPHNIIAIGFYDGIVGLWDLTTKSTLLRVREPDRSLSLLPYRCLLAHDHAVRAVAFCPSYLLVTAGEDRYVKTWDLRRPYNPITALKRCLTNEIYWPLNASGFMLAQDNSYASLVVHYFDLNQRSYFAIPRTATVWSISYTDWLNSVLTSDAFGEVIFAVLPHICYTPQYVKRTMERRFVSTSQKMFLPPLLFLGTFTGCEKRAVWKHMKSTEVKAKIHIDEFPLAALHKVRFSPNMCSHTWVVSGGRTGLVRLLCLKGMNSTPVNSKSESKAEFKVPLDSVKELEQTVRTTSDDL